MIGVNRLHGQGRTQDLELGGGGGGRKWRIQDTKSGGRFRSHIRKVEGGGGEGERFRSHIRKVGGGGGGCVRFRSDIRKVGGGGGGHSASDTFGHTDMYLPTCYLGILHTRARMKVKYMPAKVFCHPYVRGGVRPPRPPPPKSATDGGLDTPLKLGFEPCKKDLTQTGCTCNHSFL